MGKVAQAELDAPQLPRAAAVSWVIDVGVSAGTLPDGKPKRRQWKRYSTRDRDPLRSELSELLRRANAAEIRATSPDGKVEVIWTRHSKARRVSL